MINNDVYDKSFVDFVFKARMIWGNDPKVVKIPAVYPMMFRNGSI